MKSSNNDIFSKIWNKNKNESLVFITSNSGTGKTTFFKWLFLRKAIENDELLDIFFRWENDIEEKFSKSAYLKPPPKASKRLLKLAERLDIIKEDFNFYIVDTEKDNKKIARAIAVNTQAKVKSTENDILSCRALFDEVLADDNRYAPMECYKFARLVDTRARNRQYQVFCLYNNTLPFFPYFEYFKNTDAKFVSFVAEKYQTDTTKGIQKILATSNYGEVYNNNGYEYFKEFYKDFNAKGFSVLFYINIENAIFKFRDCNDFFIMEKTNKIKKSKEIFSIKLAENDFVNIEETNLVSVLQSVINKRLLFTNKKKNTIYLKLLAENLTLCYN